MLLNIGHTTVCPVLWGKMVGGTWPFPSKDHLTRYEERIRNTPPFCIFVLFLNVLDVWY